MRAILIWLVPAALIFGPATLAFADDDTAAENVLPLSLKRAVEIALAPEGSPRIALAEESIKIAQDQIREARAALLPDLESSLNDQRETVNLNAFGFSSQIFKIPAGFNLMIPSIVGPFAVLDARATASQTDRSRTSARDRRGRAY